MVAVDAGQRVVGVVNEGSDERQPREDGGGVQHRAKQREEGDVEHELGHGEDGRAVTEKDQHEAGPDGCRGRELADHDRGRTAPLERVFRLVSVRLLRVIFPVS